MTKTQSEQTQVTDDWFGIFNDFFGASDEKTSSLNLLKELQEKKHGEQDETPPKPKMIDRLLARFRDSRPEFLATQKDAEEVIDCCCCVLKNVYGFSLGVPYSVKLKYLGKSDSLIEIENIPGFNTTNETQGKRQDPTITVLANVSYISIVIAFLEKCFGAEIEKRRIFRNSKTEDDLQDGSDVREEEGYKDQRAVGEKEEYKDQKKAEGKGEEGYKDQKKAEGKEEEGDKDQKKAGGKEEEGNQEQEAVEREEEEQYKERRATKKKERERIKKLEKPKREKKEKNKEQEALEGEKRWRDNEKRHIITWLVANCLSAMGELAYAKQYIEDYQKDGKNKEFDELCNTLEIPWNVQGKKLTETMQVYCLKNSLENSTLPY